MSLRLFIAYSHEDHWFLELLEGSLRGMKDEGLISAWNERPIRGGADWQVETGNHLDCAHIVIWIVSADFLTSGYCDGAECATAMRRHRDGQTAVIPVILSDVDWKTAPFAQLPVLPSGAEPVVQWPDRDAAIEDVITGIRRSIEQRQTIEQPPTLDQPTLPLARHGEPDADQPGTPPVAPHTVGDDRSDPGSRDKEATRGLQVSVGTTARQLKLPADSVQNTIELLDDGNTIPFITRYRKDQTGGLDEEAIRRIKDAIERQRQLVQRKETILKSIHSQGKLTDQLEQRIRSADSSKILEDLYLPYKPKKRTLATIARERGLEPFADEVLEAAPAARDLEKRAAEFVNPDKHLASTTVVLAGAGHLLAERFSERADVRGKLRGILRRTGRLCARYYATTESPTEGEAPGGSAERVEVPKPPEPAEATKPPEPAEATKPPEPAEATKPPEPAEAAPSSEPPETPRPPDEAAESNDEPPHNPAASDGSGPPNGYPPKPDQAGDGVATGPVASAAPAPSESDAQVGRSSPEGGNETAEESPHHGAADDADPQVPPTDTLAAAPSSQPTSPVPNGHAPAGDRPTGTASAAPPLKTTMDRMTTAERRRQQRREARQRKRRKLEQSFKDYFEYDEAISRVPHHRVLAINRGERARVLRVKVEADIEAMHREAEQMLIPTDHPHADLLRDCVRDALTRLLLPSLEREIRRELTQLAEEHAVSVFARNLRKLLLQPPVHGRRTLALDPGFRNGCKLAALDEFGNVLDHGVIYVIGKEDRRSDARRTLAEMIRRLGLRVVAIGNGSGCREAEQLVAEMIAEEFADADVSYVIVNEAGASVYSTSELGREELTGYDATLRGAVSIGRRLLDPLSELVKINPSNIGVGLYQHDVKSKPLQASLDAVVQSCVNYVGVDVNTASPALLSYVSGLNQLTARRLYEYRCEHGPFANREQLKQVPGIGEATFVQAAGFLKITGGTNPLDATWIHPESYEVAQQVLNHIGCDLSDLAARIPPSLRPPESAPAGTPSEYGTSEDGASEDGTSEDGASEDGASVDGASVDGASVDGASVDGASVDRSMVDASQGEGAGADSGPPPSATAGPDGDQPNGQDAPTTERDAAHDPAPPPSGDAPREAATAEPVDTSPEPEPPIAPDEAMAPPTESPHASPGVDGAMAVLADRVRTVDVGALSRELEIGRLLLQDILSALARPGRDPREDLPLPVFRRGILKLEDLHPGMELSGTVLNVVDFGAFVDIGLTDTGLVHISRLADRFVRDPHEVVGIGDVLSLWVVSVDKERRRVSLTAIKPGTEKARKPRRLEASKKSTGPPQHGSSRGGRRHSTKSEPPGDRQRKPARARRQTRKPKPVVPITKAMEEGKEPMRTFSDLKQFFEKKTHGDSDEKNEPES